MLLAVHDATTGFHDIKALPRFFYFNLSLLLGAAICAGAVFLAWRIITGLRHKVPQPIPEDPFAAARSRLEQLKLLQQQESISLHILGSEASLAVRRYLGRLFGFPATEQTPREIKRILPRLASARLPRCSEHEITARCRQVDVILTSCQRTAFGDSKALLLAEPERLIDDSLSLLEQLETLQKQQATSEPAPKDAKPNAYAR